MNRPIRQHARSDPGRSLNAMDIWSMAQDPMARFADVPGGEVLVKHLMADPQNPQMRKLFGQILETQGSRALLSGDAFWPNYPPQGSLPPVVRGEIQLAALPTGDVLSIPLNGLTRNLLLVGPTGSGKTSLLRAVLTAALLAGRQTIVGFDYKGDLVDCALLTQPQLPLLVLKWHELMISMLQPVCGMSRNDFINTMVQLLAGHLDLIASRRLMLETLHLLYRRPRREGTWPTLREWIDLLEGIRANTLSRLGQYREAVLFALKEIHYSLGSVFDYVRSDMVERVVGFEGCVVIQSAGLSAEMASLLASLFINYAYEQRGLSGYEHQPQLTFVLDDALALVQARHSDFDRINPLARWAFMGRSRGIGIVVSAQNFSLVHSALKNNTENIVCCASYGRDGEELARFMNLTREQAAVLPLLRPGEVVAIARGAWPLAVRGRFPEVR